MIYPKVDKETWKKKYGLVEQEYVCPKCKKKFMTTVPVICPDLAGLETPMHPCGRGFTRAVLVPISKRAFELWGDMV